MTATTTTIKEDLYRLVFDNTYQRAMLVCIDIIQGLLEGDTQPLYDFLDYQVNDRPDSTASALEGTQIVQDAMNHVLPTVPASMKASLRWIAPMIEVPSWSNRKNLPFEISVTEEKINDLRRALDCFRYLAEGKILVAMATLHGDFFSENDAMKSPSIQALGHLAEPYRMIAVGVPDGSERHYPGHRMCFGPGECYMVSWAITHCLATGEAGVNMVQKRGSSKYLPECYLVQEKP